MDAGVRVKSGDNDGHRPNDSQASVLSVIDNILSRGMPTFPSIYIEEEICNKLNFASKEIHERTGSINFKLSDKVNDAFNA